VAAVMVVMAMVVMMTMMVMAVVVTMMVMAVMTTMVAAVMAAVTAAMALGAGEGRVEQCKAEGCGRSNGQKGGFTKHGSLLCDPWTASWRIVDCLSADRSMQLWQRFRPGMPKSGLNP
jgi:hypothetical protein